MHPTRFDSLADLARLPWFELRDGRLVVSDPSVGTAIDTHTHLALSFVRRNRVDLQRGHARAEHYLPADRAFDLDVYVNKNFLPDDLRRMERDLSLGALTGGGMRATHTVPNLTREMGELQVAQSVLLPIDWPALSDNAGTWLDAIRGDRRLIGFGSVHPYKPRMEAELDRQIALGARGIKVHPAVQLVRPDDGRALRLYRLCGERDIPVFWHCGPVDIEPPLGRYLSQVRHYEKAIAECPSTTFVLGHSGALQMETAVGFAKRYPNVWLEIASQSLTNVRRLIEHAPSDRVMFGTDWPFYHQAVGLAKVFIATDGDEAARRALLRGNAARLLKLDA
jgi:predicted TIM-barrel fold metal-dependent hydrolase